ncbi:PQQ-binding-like beta-propeller repeat protein [Streptacidiphilus sp. EB129]|uniref:outer membrane protein assembly factor BamB family protein n=1 Tax=Streptacidiphilus sp. EB129 TaxID=3156262 RepID=UPI003517C83B
MSENTPGPGGYQDGGPPPPAYAPTQAYDASAHPYPQQQAAPQQPAPGYPPQDLPTQGYAQSGYAQPQPGFGQTPYPQQGFPPQTPPPPGYPQQGVPQPGLPQHTPPPGFPPPQAFPPPGFPPQGAIPGAPQPGAPRKRLGGGLIAGIVAGIAVVVAIAVVAVMLLAGGGGPTGKTLKLAWDAQNSSVGDQRVGSWVTSTLVIRAGTDDGVVAYNLKDGSKAWTLPSPGTGLIPCSMSETLTQDGIGSIAYGPNRLACSMLTAVDTTTGKVLWTKTLDLGEHTQPLLAATYVQGSVVTIVGETTLGGFNARTGSPVWSYRGRGQYCSVYPYGISGAVLVDEFCADATPAYALSELDGATGKVDWTKAQTGHTQFLTVLNASPLVAVQQPESGGQNTVVYDAGGNSTPIKLLAQDLGNNDGAHSVQLVGKTLVLQHQKDPNANPDSTAGPIAAYDLGTGAMLWSYDGESKHGAVLLEPSADGTMYALSTGSQDGVPHLVRLDPATGKSTLLSTVTGTGVDGWSLSDITAYVATDGSLVTMTNFAGATLQTFR